MSADYYQELGLSKFTISIESQLEEFIQTLSNSHIASEIIVHGLPCVLYLEHDLYENTNALTPKGQEDTAHVDNSTLTLVTPTGEYPVYKDQHERCHMLPSKELCLCELISSLNKLPIASYRIEADSYTSEELDYLINIYQKLIKINEINYQIKKFSGGHTLGALNH